MTQKSTNKIPRGFRNHNPLNIRIGNTWLGEVADPTDSDFEQFVSDLTHHDPDELIVFEDKALIVAIVRAMVQMECGSTISLQLVERAYDMT